MVEQLVSQGKIDDALLAWKEIPGVDLKLVTLISFEWSMIRNDEIYGTDSKESLKSRKNDVVSRILDDLSKLRPRT